MNHSFVYILLIASLQVFANPGNEIVQLVNEQIDKQQYDIDVMDGKADGLVTLPNTYNTERATDLYIHKINELQREVTDRDQPWMHTRDQLREIKNWLLDTPTYGFGELEYLDKIELSYSLFTGTNDSFVIQKLEQNVDLIITHYDYIQQKPFAYDLLKSLVNKDAQQFVMNSEIFQDSPAFAKIIDELVIENPIKMKRWVNSDTAIGKVIQSSTSSASITLRHLMNEYGMASRSYFFIQDIIDDKLTVKQAHDKGESSKQFRDALIDLSKRKQFIGREAVDIQLKDESLSVIRPVNELHETKDPTKRFQSVKELSAEEFYTFMVYPQEEIFTSTYNGFYERMVQKLPTKNSYDFLQSMNFNQYRTFLKMAAGYNKLSDFLSRMSEDQQKTLLTMFVSNLEEGNQQESLQASVEVADTFGSITDKVLREFFTSKMKEEFERVSQANNRHGMRIYSLLNGILAQSDGYSSQWMEDLVKEYHIPNITKLDYQSLLNRDGKLIQQVFFYDDDDGKASYHSFLPTFRNANWTIKDKEKYIKITSKGGDVQIYANKPEHEFDGKAELRKVFRNERISPSVVIHRGHSFYVDTTIYSLTPNAKLVLLGSCGSYHSLRSVIEKSPQVHIISSKQIGSMGVNDPMIRLLNSHFLKEETIDWQSFWTTLGGQLKSNSKTHERFQDYVPPHQNLGAIFIMAYNRLKWNDERQGL